MLSAHPPLRSVTAAVLSALLCCGTLLPQKAFSSTQDVKLMLLLYSGALTNTCESVSTGGSSNATREATATAGEGRVPCETIPVAAPAELSHSVADSPVHDAGAPMWCTQADDLEWKCMNYESVVRAELLAMGKNGEKIMHARDRVLEILEQPNSCSAWFQQKDRNADTTFRSLSYTIDAKGSSFIYKEMGDQPGFLLKNPYVARVIQDGGSYQTITLNLNGAFFQSFAPMMETHAIGGAGRLLTPKNLAVGPYEGGKLAAQVAALLHELGHLEGLLPPDQGDVQGKSQQNTHEVLEHCRAEVDDSGKRVTLAASR